MYDKSHEQDSKREGINMNVNEVAAALKSHWDKWSVVQRSRTLHRLKAAGYSGYELADLVGCSETNIRKVMEVALMSPYELALIQAGESMRKVRKLNRARKRQEQNTVLLRAVDRAHRKIQLWLRTARLAACFEEQLFLEILALDRGKPGPPCSLTAQEIIARTRPQGFDHATGIDRFNLEIDWLFAFTQYGIHDGEVRELALRRALSRAGRNLEPPIL
jgi:hypothetical protein